MSAAFMNVALSHQKIPETYYCRRKPEKTVLYKTVSEQMNTVFGKMEMENRYLPEYVKEEFSSFLDCGILSQGFLRLTCNDCKSEKLVAFS
jgi:hypothetical protein